MSARALFIRAAAFLALFAAMYVALAQTWEHGASRWVIDVGTVRPAAFFARLIVPDSAVIADGPVLRSPGATVRVLFGCEGMDVFMLLAAAVLAAPARWRARLAGVALGAALVFVLNQGRVLALFFALRAQNGWFGPIHGLLAPIAIVVLATGFYLLWLDWAERAGAPPAP